MFSKIGIIVPVYNVEKYLDKCVSSIIGQSFENWQLILVDDGSPDTCPQICDNYATLDSRIKVVHKKNGGLVSAWIAGLHALEASVEYVVFIDSDDWISKDYLRVLYDYQVLHNSDVVVTQLRNVFPDNTSIQRKFVLPVRYYNREDITNNIFPCLLNTGSFHSRAISCSRCGKLIKKSLIIENMHYVSTTTTYCEDLNITFPIFLDMNSIEFVVDDNCLYYIRANPYSMTHAYDRNMLNSIVYVYDSIELIICNKGLNSILYSQFLADYLAASVQFYKNELLNPQGIKKTQINIYNFCKSNRRLQLAINTVDWKKYRLLNRIIIRSLNNYTGVNRFLVTPALKMLKRIRANRLLAQS